MEQVSDRQVSDVLGFPLITKAEPYSPRAEPYVQRATASSRYYGY